MTNVLNTTLAGRVRQDQLLETIYRKIEANVASPKLRQQLKLKFLDGLRYRHAILLLDLVNALAQYKDLNVYVNEKAGEILMARATSGWGAGAAKDLRLLLEEFVKNHDDPEMRASVGERSVLFDEILTPLWVVEGILDDIDVQYRKDNPGAGSIFENPDLTWLDPCANSGGFSICLMGRLMAHLPGFSSEEAKLTHIMENMVFQVEYQAAACALNLLLTEPVEQWDNNLFHGSFLEKAKDRQADCGKKVPVFSGKVNPKFLQQAVEGAWADKLEGGKFDVVMGNPPYSQPQTADEDRSAISMVTEFIQASLSLTRQYCSMVVPSKWMLTGKHREEILSKNRLCAEVKLPDGVFDAAEINGISYTVLAAGQAPEDAFDVRRLDDGMACSESQDTGRLLDLQSFGGSAEKIPVTNSLQINVINALESRWEQEQFTSVCAGTLRGVETPRVCAADVEGARECLLRDSWGHAEVTPGWARLDGRYKVVIVQANGGRPEAVIGRVEILGKQDICTKTYQALASFDTRAECDNFIEYLSTRAVRYLIQILKGDRGVPARCYQLVPLLDFTVKRTEDEVFDVLGLADLQDQIISDPCVLKEKNGVSTYIPILEPAAWLEVKNEQKYSK